MYWNFYNDRILFLEKMVEQHPENKEFIQSYTKLIEKEIDLEIKRLDFDVQIHRNNTDFNKNNDNNQTEYAVQQLKENKQLK